MWRRTCSAVMFAAVGCLAGVASGADDLQSAIQSCAQDTGPANCPATYQAVRASDCLGSGNRECLIRKAKEAAGANDCDRAYQLVYACQCGSTQEPGKTLVKAAGAAGVCKYFKGG
ncbi:MAG: hypothetical protein ABI624_10450 [Casimicrobiaceae bacterium]